MATLTHAQIAEHAYHIWEQEGRPHGRDFDHWLRAEQEMSRRRPRKPARSSAGTTKTPKAKRATRSHRKTQ